MGSDLTAPLQLEIAHVLYMDVVEYSLLPGAEQRRLLASLQDLLRGTVAFRRAEESGELLRLPTGDGAALAFFRDPVAPLECALELAVAVRDLPLLKLRMGLHSGPVYHMEDINQQANLTGGGMNLAERVMGCGDAGHILVSSSIAELLVQVGDWSGSLHDLGECEVKHGLRLHLFNVYTGEAGNPALPMKLRAAPATVAPPRTVVEVRPAVGTAQVALLYKRNAQPDEQLLELLERHLRAHGYRIFIDRHLAIGVEWAKEIERQIRGSDAVIPLLSPASVESEMLQYEMQIARDAQCQHGKPRLLPVRAGFTGALPPPLATILDPLEYALWTGPQDDERLLADLLHALQSPLEATPSAPRARLEPAGGAVPLDSAFYIERPTDEQFRAAISRHDSLVLVKGARQMGKTSLLARGLQQAREAGARWVLTDFQALDAAHLESSEALYLTLAEWIAEELDLQVFPDEVWTSRRGPSRNFEQYLRREVLGKIDAPLVWGLDEVDRLFTCGFGGEVFGLFRSWHNKRALDPSGPWQRLTLAIAYATEAHLFITDMNQSPFNVGTRLTLEDFTFEHLADLNRRYGSPLRDEAAVARYYRLLGGHPYLVRRGLDEIATQEMSIAAFEAQADRDDGIFGDHLRRILVSLANNPELCDAVKGVLCRRPCPTAESFYHLRTAGVLAGEAAREARPRCQLYATYLERHLL